MMAHEVGPRQAQKAVPCNAQQVDALVVLRVPFSSTQRQLVVVVVAAEAGGPKQKVL
jgi:hypothetical protein